MQREIFTEEDQDTDIPKEISSEQNILHSNNQIGNFFLRDYILRVCKYYVLFIDRDIHASQELSRSLSIDERSKEVCETIKQRVISLTNCFSELCTP